MADAAAPATNDKGELSYKEMRAVAQEIYNIEKKARRIRTCAMVCGGLLVGTCVFLGGMVLLYGIIAETEVSEDRDQLALIKKGSKQVVATTESVEDLDGADLVEYAHTGTDSNGDADGNWVLSEARISMIRTISWREDDTMNIYHIAGITRYDGTDTRVELTTKAGHLITLWDSDGEDNYNINMKLWFTENSTFGPEFEVNGEADDAEGTGRGRVVVNLRRPTLENAGHPANVENYF